MSSLLLFILSPIILWGLADMYICYRWVRKPEVDTTAGVSTYWWTKWLAVTKAKVLAERLGYPSLDLSEALRIVPDDEEVT